MESNSTLLVMDDFWCRYQNLWLQMDDEISCGDYGKYSFEKTCKY